ncbi:hypothetical protein KBB96_07565 [Luteolibacter ambystomatis]|uniref:Uncharacterized protein n=1 Tax=Luteolibacter ambystomatis TaxID=2824561 RepID=A0A975J2C5_9BACT|nr:hypothetical protein [Luteolibacter ambystomatis]QUE52741.1 hypothetical protein KBB96_07565 [Luteolibacter ambystomatis]
MKPSSRNPLFPGSVPLSLVLAASAASAQVVQIVPLQPAAQAQPAQPVNPQQPAQPAGEAAAGPAKEGEKKEADPTKELAKELKSMRFDRSGEALLAATKSQKKDTPPTPAETFGMAVMFGDWTEVGKTLATLPPQDASAIYGKLLDSLGDQSISVGAVLKTPENSSDEDEDPRERMQRQMKEREELKKKPAPILSEDFYAIVNANPADLKEENIPALTKLVKTALGEGGRATLVTRMEKGWKGLGGTTSEGRKLATRLLSSLGWIRDAGPFLPLKKEDWDDAETSQLIFAMEYFTRTGVEEKDERQLQQAADLAARVMKTARFGNYTRPQFRPAMERLVQLLPALDPAQAQKLIREQLFNQTATLSELIGIIGELGQNASKGTDVQARASSLGTQHLILEALAGKEGALPSNTAVLVMNWLNEAEACYRAGGVVTTEMSQAERMMLRRYGYGNNQEKAPTLSTEQVLSTAPPKALIARLNPGLAQRVELTLVKVGVLLPDEADLSLLKDYVKKYPGLEREVCQDVLAGWVSKRTKPAESEQVKQMRAYGYYIPPQMQQQGSGIPLTRLRQNQNIQHFKALLGDLRSISPEPLDPKLIVQAFMTLHSGAEVYRMEDIEAIFGPPEKMVQKELLDLLGGMRGRLNQEWRDPKTQQQAGTNRTEQEAKDEVSRGYRTALELAKRGIRPESEDWSAFITRGQLFYDASQYELQRQVKLTDYVNLRDESFASFRKATELYAAKIPTLPSGQWTIEPYQAWFFVMLGASDLAQLTTNTARVDPGLKSIGDAMRALPGDAGPRHLEIFAKMLGEVFPRVPANMRQLFLGSGLGIVGADNPAASAATKSLDYYKELLDEIQLRIKVDGPSRVGHGQPFGAVVSLETTRQLLRESGGFSKYLQNQSDQQRSMFGGGEEGGSKNLRDDFTKNIHAALDETFEVVSITFHDAAVKTIDLPREGWVETPLAYMVLRSKTAAVDRIPSVQLDVDFVDQPGQVVLPVMSQVEPIDSHDADVENRPCGDLALSLTMDEREWKDGKVVVEIQARGQGVIPDLDKLFDTRREGFDLESVDGKLSVSQFVSDGKKRLPQADRNWQLTYRRKADLKGDVTFPFPALKSGVKPASIDYKHYQDADLVEIDAAKATAGVKLAGRTGSWLGTSVIVVLLVAAIAALIAFLKKRKRQTAEVAKELSAPSNPTPFSTVAFLRRIGLTHGDTMSDGEKVALCEQIAEIESRYFSAKETSAGDLSPVISKWLEVARRSSGVA